MCSTEDAWPAAALGQGAPGSGTEFLVPVGLDLASPSQQREAAAAVAAGIAALPALAEIYPLGGAGDRLGLQCEQTGESLPTAVLQYCGRSLLENLLRDLQVGGDAVCGFGGGAHEWHSAFARVCCAVVAGRLPRPEFQAGKAARCLVGYLKGVASTPPSLHALLCSRLLPPTQAREYLYWKLHGAQHTTPVAIMTSAAKGNHWRVEQLFEQADWFGRWAAALLEAQAGAAAVTEWQQVGQQLFTAGA